MRGKFNGLPLTSITAVTSETDIFGRKLKIVRVPSFPLPELEQRLHLNLEVQLVLSADNVNGRIIRYAADVDHGYEITIETQKEVSSVAMEHYDRATGTTNTN